MTPARDGSSPTFFASPAAFRRWLAKNHRTATELLVGYHKKHTDTPSMTWPESVDEALCYGWIDGIRRRVDADRYSIRFTPRRPTSIWSAINIARVQVLTKERRMRAAGRAAYERRDEKTSAIYAYEQVKKAKFTPAHRKALRANAVAWKGFAALPPSHRQRFTYWVTSAKQEATREKRMAKLIATLAAGTTP